MYQIPIQQEIDTSNRKIPIPNYQLHTGEPVFVTVKTYVLRSRANEWGDTRMDSHEFVTRNQLFTAFRIRFDFS